MEGQLNLFDVEKTPLAIRNKIYLIELFAGVGSQAMGLRDIGANFVHHKVCEFDRFAIASYNAIHGTNFLCTDIRSLKGKDLEITDTVNRTYLLTYSFPCTDLSVAGKQKGMEKGSGTSSSLLWEVERLLTECEELSRTDPNYGLPQVLLMENITQVHSKGQNLDNFNKWISFLESLGYSSKWCDLNAKDYNVPQNRNRCFMVSWLGQHTYEFPKPMELQYCMNDFLEEEVDEKFYCNTEKANELIQRVKERFNGELPTENIICTPEETKLIKSGFQKVSEN